eukprot:2915923-Amphidinium_carterae.1
MHGAFELEVFKDSLHGRAANIGRRQKRLSSFRRLPTHGGKLSVGCWSANLRNVGDLEFDVGRGCLCKWSCLRVAILPEWH